MSSFSETDTLIDDGAELTDSPRFAPQPLPAALTGEVQPGVGRLKTIGSQFARGALGQIAGELKGAARVGERMMAPQSISELLRSTAGMAVQMVPIPIPGVSSKIAGVLGTEDREKAAEFEGRLRRSPLHVAGTALEEAAAETYPVNPEYASEFWSGLIPQTIGQQLPIIAESILARRAGGKGLGRAGAGVGYGLAQGAQMAEDAVKAGHPEDAETMFRVGAVVGALTESALGAAGMAGSRLANIGSKNVIDRVGPLVAILQKHGMNPSAATRWALGTIQTSGFEGLQEGLEQLSQNIGVKLTWNPEQKVWDSVPLAMAAGAVVGGLVGGGIEGLGTVERRNRLRQLDRSRQLLTGEVQQPWERAPQQYDRSKTIRFRRGQEAFNRLSPMLGIDVEEARNVDLVNRIMAEGQARPPTTDPRQVAIERLAYTLASLDELPTRESVVMSLVEQWGMNRGQASQLADAAIRQIGGTYAIQEQVADESGVRGIPRPGDETQGAAVGARDATAEAIARSQAQAKPAGEVTPPLGPNRTAIKIKTKDGTEIAGAFYGYVEYPPEFKKAPVPAVSRMVDGKWSDGALGKDEEIVGEIPTFEEWKKGVTTNAQEVQRKEEEVAPAAATLPMLPGPRVATGLPTVPGAPAPQGPSMSAVGGTTTIAAPTVTPAPPTPPAGGEGFGRYTTTPVRESMAAVTPGGRMVTAMPTVPGAPPAQAPPFPAVGQVGQAPPYVPAPGPRGAGLEIFGRQVPTPVWGSLAIVGPQPGALRGERPYVPGAWAPGGGTLGSVLSGGSVKYTEEINLPKSTEKIASMIDWNGVRAGLYQAATGRGKKATSVPIYPEFAELTDQQKDNILFATAAVSQKTSAVSGKLAVLLDPDGVVHIGKASKNRTIQILPLKRENQKTARAWRDLKAEGWVALNAITPSLPVRSFHAEMSLEDWQIFERLMVAKFDQMRRGAEAMDFASLGDMINYDEDFTIQGLKLQEILDWFTTVSPTGWIGKKGQGPSSQPADTFTKWANGEDVTVYITGLPGARHMKGLSDQERRDLYDVLIQRRQESQQRKDELLGRIEQTGGRVAQFGDTGIAAYRGEAGMEREALAQERRAAGIESIKGDAKLMRAFDKLFGNLVFNPTPSEKALFMRGVGNKRLAKEAKYIGPDEALAIMRLIWGRTSKWTTKKQAASDDEATAVLNLIPQSLLDPIVLRASPRVIQTKPTTPEQKAKQRTYKALTDVERAHLKSEYDFKVGSAIIYNHIINAHKLLFSKSTRDKLTPERAARLLTGNPRPGGGWGGQISARDFNQNLAEATRARARTRASLAERIERLRAATNPRGLERTTYNDVRYALGQMTDAKIKSILEELTGLYAHQRAYIVNQADLQLDKDEDLKAVIKQSNWTHAVIAIANSLIEGRVDRRASAARLEQLLSTEETAPQRETVNLGMAPPGVAEEVITRTALPPWRERVRLEKLEKTQARELVNRLASAATTEVERMSKLQDIYREASDKYSAALHKVGIATKLVSQSQPASFGAATKKMAPTVADHARAVARLAAEEDALRKARLELEAASQALDTAHKTMALPPAAIPKAINASLAASENAEAIADELSRLRALRDERLSDLAAARAPRKQILAESAKFETEIGRLNRKLDAAIKEFNSSAQLQRQEQASVITDMESASKELRTQDVKRIAGKVNAIIYRSENKLKKLAAQPEGRPLEPLREKVVQARKQGLWNRLGALTTQKQPQQQKAKPAPNPPKAQPAPAPETAAATPEQLESLKKTGIGQLAKAAEYTEALADRMMGQHIQKNRGRTSSNPLWFLDPTPYAALVLKVAAKLMKGGVAVAQITSDLIAEYGPQIQQYASEIFTKANNLISRGVDAVKLEADSLRLASLGGDAVDRLRSDAAALDQPAFNTQQQNQAENEVNAIIEAARGIGGDIIIPSVMDRDFVRQMAGLGLINDSNRQRITSAVALIVARRQALEGADILSEYSQMMGTAGLVESLDPNGGLPGVASISENLRDEAERLQAEWLKLKPSVRAEAQQIYNDWQQDINRHSSKNALTFSQIKRAFLEPLNVLDILRQATGVLSRPFTESSVDEYGNSVADNLFQAARTLKRLYSDLKTTSEVKDQINRATLTQALEKIANALEGKGYAELVLSEATNARAAGRKGEPIRGASAYLSPRTAAKVSGMYNAIGRFARTALTKLVEQTARRITQDEFMRMLPGPGFRQAFKDVIGDDAYNAMVQAINESPAFADAVWRLVKLSEKVDSLPSTKLREYIKLLKSGKTAKADALYDEIVSMAESDVSENAAALRTATRQARAAKIDLLAHEKALAVFEEVLNSDEFKAIESAAANANLVGREMRTENQQQVVWESFAKRESPGGPLIVQPRVVFSAADTGIYSDKYVHQMNEYVDAANDYITLYDLLSSPNNSTGETPQDYGMDQATRDGLYSLLHANPIGAKAFHRWEATSKALTLKPSSVYNRLLMFPLFRNIEENARVLPGLFGAQAKAASSNILQMSGKIGAFTRGLPFRKHPSKRTAALRSHPEFNNVIETYRTMLYNELAHLARQPGAVVRPGMKVNGITVTPEDIEFVRAGEE